MYETEQASTLVPPHDLDAERSVLASCMHSPAAVKEAVGILAADDFYRPAHEAIWAAIVGLYEAGDHVDEITVMSRLMTDGQAAHARALPEVATAYVAAVAVRSHAMVVRDHATRRRVIAAGTRAIQLGSGLEDSPYELAEVAAAEMLAAARPTEDSTPTIADQVAAALDAIEDTATAGWDWPWHDLSRILIPPAPGQFILFAARPRVGKSVALVDIARHVALKRGLPVVLHSLEMSATEVLHRIIAAEAKVPLSHMKDPDLRPTEDEWDRIAKTMARITESPLHIIDNPTVGLPDVRASIREHQPAVVLFDYFQLGRTNPAIKERRVALEEMSRGFKILAKETGIPIIAAAQVNRDSTKRSSGAPMLSELRETGSLEQDCDTAVILHRDDAEEPECERAGEMDLIVAKQRNGPQGRAILAHQLHYSRLVDMAA